MPHDHPPPRVVHQHRVQNAEGGGVMSETFEDPTPIDGPLCGRFGSGAFPCGPVFKVRVTTHSGGPRRADVTRRHALCEAHYTFLTTKTKVSGGAGGFKARAKGVAMQRLAAAHIDEFQSMYETALVELCAAAEPPIEPRLLLGRDPAGGAA